MYTIEKRILALKLVAMCVFLQLMTGCATVNTPRYIVSFTPIDSAGLVWEKGKQIIARSNEDSRIKVSSTEPYRALIQMNIGNNLSSHRMLSNKIEINIENNSNDTIDFDPSRIRIVRKVKNLEGSAVRDTVLNATDRDKMLENCKHAKIRLEQQKNPYETTGAELAASAVGATLDIASIFVNQTPEQKREQRERTERDNLNRQEKEINRIEWASNHKQNLLEWEREIAFWDKDVVGRSTLYPKTNLAGAILFPFIRQTSEVVLNIPVGKSTFSIKLQQNAIRNDSIGIPYFE